MPVQAIKASRAHAAGHIRDNLWLWIGIFGAITIVTGLMRWSVGHASIWGDMLAFSGMITGMLIIVKSQQGFVSLHAPPEDQDEPA